MLSRTFFFGLVVLTVPAAVFSACSSSSSSPTTSSGGDSGGGGQDASADSKCGRPGDQGNELGVGKYCMTFQECVNNSQSMLCSVVGDKDTHFCTKTCPDPDGGEAGANACGTAATCTCNDQGQCGCTPNKCLGG